MVVTFFVLLLIFFLGTLFSMLFWFWKNFRGTNENKLVNIKKPSVGSQIVVGFKISFFLISVALFCLFIIFLIVVNIKGDPFN